MTSFANGLGATDAFNPICCTYKVCSLAFHCHPSVGMRFCNKVFDLFRTRSPFKLWKKLVETLMSDQARNHEGAFEGKGPTFFVLLQILLCPERCLYSLFFKHIIKAKSCAPNNVFCFFEP